MNLAQLALYKPICVTISPNATLDSAVIALGRMMTNALNRSGIAATLFSPTEPLPPDTLTGGHVYIAVSAESAAFLATQTGCIQLTVSLSRLPSWLLRIGRFLWSALGTTAGVNSVTVSRAALIDNGVTL